MVKKIPLASHLDSTSPAEVRLLERTLGNYRRLVVRYERTLRIYPTFFHVACLLITLRQL